MNYKIMGLLFICCLTFSTQHTLAMHNPQELNAFTSFCQHVATLNNQLNACEDQLAHHGSDSRLLRQQQNLKAQIAQLAEQITGLKQPMTQPERCSKIKKILNGLRYTISMLIAAKLLCTFAPAADASSMYGHFCSLVSTLWNWTSSTAVSLVPWKTINSNVVAPLSLNVLLPLAWDNKAISFSVLAGSLLTLPFWGKWILSLLFSTAIKLPLSCVLGLITLPCTGFCKKQPLNQEFVKRCAILR